MTHFVVDASVALKWLTTDPGTEAALRLPDHTLFAPDLLLVECANALWRKQRLGELNAEEVFLGTKLLTSGQIEFEGVHPLVQDALQLALALGHPVYDCVYLALAQQRHITLVTADTRLLGVLRRTFVPGISSLAIGLDQVT